MVLYTGGKSKLSASKTISNRLKLSLIASIGVILLSSGQVWAQCAPPPGSLSISAGDACVDNDASRLSNSGTAVNVDGGSYTGTNVTISTTTNSAFGVDLQNNGTVVLKDTTITTSDRDAYGIRADSGLIEAKNLTITTDGYASDAITLTGPATVNLDGAEIQVNGSSARGIRTQNGATVVGSNVNIVSTQTNPAGPPDGYGSSHGITSESGSSVTLFDSSITVTGPQSSGVEVWSGGKFHGERLVIKTSSNDSLSTGLAALSPGSTATLIDSTISVDGQEVVAVYASGAAAIDLKNVDMATAGDAGVGVMVIDAETTVNITDNSVINTIGADAHGLQVLSGGQVTIADANVTVTGDGASTIAITESAASDDAHITITGGNFSSAQAPLILVEGGDGEIIMNGPIGLSAGSVDGRQIFASVTNVDALVSDFDFTANSVSEILGDIDVTGAGNTMRATFNQSHWFGDLTVADGNNADISLSGSEWTGRSTNATSITTDVSSIWNVTASSDAGLVTNAGLIAFDPAAAGFPTLTVNDYVGQNGNIQLNTVLNADNSPTNVLIVDGGTASGTTSLIIANAGGTGEQTLGDGIQVVQTVNGGTTEESAFNLANRTAAGAYEYLLFRGGATASEDWFLRSHLIAPGASEPDVPLYRPEVALYTPVPAIARQMGMAFLGTLHERVGEQMNIKARPDQDEYANGAWARLIGEAGKTSWSGTVDAQARNSRLFGIQAGLDIYRAEHSNRHRDHLGVYAGYGWHNSRIDGNVLGENRLRVGKLKLDGPVLGAYWTHYAPAGTYIDGVLQVNWFDGHGDSDFGTGMKTRGTGFTASLEAGHPFQSGDQWQIEPQAQIIYQSMSVKSGHDAFSAFSWDEDDAVTGRLGVRLQYTSKDGEQIWQPYAKANLWHGFRGTDKAKFGSTIINNHFGATSLELGAGFTAKVSETASLYGHIDHRWQLDGREKHNATHGGFGLRVNW
ncbi:outer membrane autotransporter protein [Falsochrobactrum ovis]|uniref:Outer membrane autotransporter protein n=1 Tax=Falsochrobactrum ovis TaxID=1293442 RepID=A0A364JW48_9HYPH|nr:outer membrane autotransporter protein [Falsochrobactrum ovis]